MVAIMMLVCEVTQAVVLPLVLHLLFQQHNSQMKSCVIYTGDSFDSFRPGHYVQIMPPTDHSWEVIDLESTATIREESGFVGRSLCFGSSPRRFFFFLCVFSETGF